MENYRSNSHKSREAGEKNIKPVASGRLKKKSSASKLADVFVSKDVSDVKDYLLFDVIVPTIKDALMDTLRMVLYGGDGGRGNRNNHTRSTISYGRYYEKDRERRSTSLRPRTGYDFDDILLDSYADADAVLEQMQEMINVYDVVSVADLYELVGKSGRSFTDNKYGWSDLHGAKPVRVSDGYILKLPRALPIDS